MCVFSFYKMCDYFSVLASGSLIPFHALIITNYLFSFLSYSPSPYRRRAPSLHSMPPTYAAAAILLSLFGAFGTVKFQDCILTFQTYNMLHRDFEMVN